jgi:hypothetical protein
MAKETPEAPDFSQLILGFSTAALLYMGENPVQGQNNPEKNLALANQNILIIKMLREKTAGNLTADEQELIDQLLTDLQIKFVNCSTQR